jgi:hypothetical protein
MLLVQINYNFKGDSHNWPALPIIFHETAQFKTVSLKGDTEHTSVFFLNNSAYVSLSVYFKNSIIKNLKMKHETGSLKFNQH